MEITFGEWLKRRRQQLYLTQKELAHRAGCGLTTLRKIEYGSRRPSVDLARQLGTALDVPEAELVAFVSFARADPDTANSPEFASDLVTLSPLELPSAAALPTEAPPPPPVLDQRLLSQQPFVAREDILATLADAFSQAVVGKLPAAFITAEAGAGKSALVRELAARVVETTPNVIVTVGECGTYVSGDSTYQPWRQILNQLAGDVENAYLRGSLTAVAARRLWSLMPQTARALLTHGPNLRGILLHGAALLSRLGRPVTGSEAADDVAHLLAGPPAAVGELERSVLFGQYAAVLRALSEAGPLLLIVEDLHEADTATLELLAYLVPQLRAAPVFLIGTFRPRADSAAPLHRELSRIVTRFQRTENTPIVDLDEVVVTESAAFVDALLAAERYQLTDGARAALLARTGGHPLFTVELLAWLRDLGDAKSNKDGVWILPAEEAGLPDRVEGVLRERFERLEGPVRRLLMVAAVQGETFTAEVVAQVADRPVRDVVIELSQTLGRTYRLVQSVGTVAVNGQRLSQYRFHHALFHNYVYGRLDAVERTYLHEDVGLTLEQMYAGQPELPAAELSRHFRAAGLIRKALRYTLQAGDTARLGYAYIEAARNYEIAVEVLKKQGDIETTARTLMKLGLTYQLAGKHGAARQAFRKGFAAWQKASTASHRLAHPPAPHPLRLAVQQLPQSLDIRYGMSIYEIRVLRQLFTALIEINVDGELVPGVASSWEILDAGHKILFYLRDDVQWSDGEPVTAADFVLAVQRALFSARDGGIIDERLMNICHAQDYWRGTVPVESVKFRALDSHTIIVELDRPIEEFHTWNIWPVPSHKVRNLGKSWSEPELLIGNGPFQIKTWRPGDRSEFTRNPYFKGHIPGNVNHVVLQQFPKGGNPLTLYERDALDLIDLGTVRNVEQARQLYAAEYVTAPWRQTTSICFDLRREPFNDPRVRRALALAIDRDYFADVILRGHSFPADGGVIPPGVAGHQVDINSAYDPLQARNLLAEAGYPNGHGFPDVLGYGWRVESVNDALSAQWQEALGIDIKFQVSGSSSQSADPSIRLVGWMAANDATPSHMLKLFAYTFNLVGYDESFDALLDKVALVRDPQERLEIYCQADRLLVHLALAIPLAYGQGQFLVKPWLGGAVNWTDLIWADMVISPH